MATVGAQRMVNRGDRPMYQIRLEGDEVVRRSGA
jgi:hypothetical protein